MSSALNRSVTPIVSRNPWLAWMPVAIGLCALYLPTFITLWNGVWNTEEQGHGPLILAVVAYLLWRNRERLIDQSDQPALFAGWTVLAFGLLLYVLGRSQQILMFEVGSQIPVLAGSVLVLRGRRSLSFVWFPLFFIVFMVPLPGFVVDALTNPLKRHVSEIAEFLLYGVGYPIARSGVTLSIGPYQLLVADACSGLHSLYSLTALGLLYMHLMNHKSVMRQAILAVAILPIAFAANIARVIFLVLVTYHFGDEAGQGFLHGFAGIVLFVVALLSLFALDGLLGAVFMGTGPMSSVARDKS